MSLISTLTPEEQGRLQSFISRVISKEKLINQIQQLLFDQSFYARFLKGNQFDEELSIKQMRNYLKWRKEQNIDQILDYEFQQFDQIKALCPSGFHSTDKEGRPIFIIQIGQIKTMELMEEIKSVDVLVHFFIKELEHTWRNKFADCKEFINKKGVDQIKVIVDMKGTKLKDMTNQSAIKIYRQLVLEVQRYFPELLHKLYVVNAPTFFENVWETQLMQCISDTSDSSKILVTSGNTHQDLLDEVDEYELPKIYGGNCSCKSKCVYSEKGPWTEVENQIDYQNPVVSDDDDDLGESELYHQFKGMNLGNGLEEFKMQEDDEDNVDLLAEKEKMGGNHEDFFEAQQEQLFNLKNQIQSDFKINSVPGIPGGGQTNNNTQVTECDSEESQIKKVVKLAQSGTFNNNLINIPGMTPQAKNKFSQ